MDDDDDFFDFNYDDLSDEEKEEIDREYQAERKAIRTSPLFRKANEIYSTVSALVESLSDEDKNFYQSILLESASILAPKIAGAMGSGNWIICMQNASLIRYHAEYLLTSTSGLKLFTKAEKDYIQLLRIDMEEFRELFKAWVATFAKLDREEYTDEWGLFIR
jgi:hypothetical protein